MSLKKNFKGIFKPANAPDYVVQEINERVDEYKYSCSDLNQPELVTDLLYLAWLYAHGYLFLVQEPSLKEKLNITYRKNSHNTFSLMDDYSLSFSYENIEKMNHVFTELSCIYTQFNLGDFTEDMRNINPEKINILEVLKSLDNYTLLKLIGHFKTKYECYALGTNEVTVIYFTWLWHNGFVEKNEFGLYYVTDDLVDFKYHKFKPFKGIEQGISNGIDFNFFEKYYELNKIIEITGWHENEHYMRRHQVKKSLEKQK